MTNAKALKLALSLLHEERHVREAVGAPVADVLDAIERLEALHGLHKRADDAHAKFEAKRRRSVRGDK